MRDDNESDWERLAQRCAAQASDWERVVNELHALASDESASRLRLPADHELLVAFEEATEVRRSTTGALTALSMMRG